MCDLHVIAAQSSELTKLYLFIMINNYDVINAMDICSETDLNHSVMNYM